MQSFRRYLAGLPHIHVDQLKDYFGVGDIIAEYVANSRRIGKINVGMIVQQSTGRYIVIRPHEGNVVKKFEHDYEHLVELIRSSKEVEAFDRSIRTLINSKTIKDEEMREYLLLTGNMINLYKLEKSDGREFLIVT